MDKIKVLISEEELQKRIVELGKQISKEYDKQQITILCILKGASFFAVDLAKKIDLDVYFEFIQLSSYEGEESTGKIDVIKDIDISKFKDRNVLIVEDIIDTGRTMRFLIEKLKDSGAKSVKICTLLNKAERREQHVNIDYTAFEIPNKFVLGYGLDYNELYRNLSYVGYIE